MNEPKPEDLAVTTAYLALFDAVRARWQVWSEASPDNARLRRIATRISGLDGRMGMAQNIVCTGEPPVASSRAPIKHHLVGYGELMPAWAMWVPLARDALEALNDG